MGSQIETPEWLTLLRRAKVLIENNSIRSREEGATYKDATKWLRDLRDFFYRCGDA